MFEEKAKQELFETVKAFHACKQEEGQSVSSYLLKMKSYLDTLERLGYAMLNELGVSLILNSLNKDYDQFVQNYNMHSMGKTIAELHAMLKLHEKGILKKAKIPAVLPIREGKIQKNKRKPRGAKGKDKGKNKLAYDPKPKILPLPKRDNQAKDSICHHYKEVGYWRRNCPSYQAELKKRKEASMDSTSGIFTIELYAFPNKTWVYDTSCGTHICNTLQGLRRSKKLKHRALSLYIGNGMRPAVETIGNFDLILPSGLIIVLNNYHFAPTVTMGVVSISCLVENGYIHTFTNNGISVSKDNGYALESVAHILNMVPTKKVERMPYNIWQGKAPMLSYLRVWGCEALVKRDALEKLDPRSIKCTDIPKITRKPSKTGKHGHENQKSTKRSQRFKAEARKVKPQSKSVKKSQSQSKMVKLSQTQKDKSSKCFTLVPQLSQKSKNVPSSLIGPRKA
ncbi:hypothetical protein Tco_0816374 [Tanacetum coccineum]